MAIYKIDNQQGPTVYHREYFVITYKGKESEKKCINHFTEHLNLTQYCNSLILQ